MTTTNISKGSSPLSLSKVSKLLKRTLAGMGLAALLFLGLLIFSNSARSFAANALSQWSNSRPSSDKLVLAPFEFEVEDIEADLISIPSGASKVPVGLLASLPVLELNELSPQQVKVTNWIANRYRVAPEMVALLVQESWNIGERTGIDPTLLLGIIAIESRFNPYAQSAVGATGLMQVMTNVHSAKFDRIGGIIAVFDPVTNLRVGAQVLQEHVRRAGSLEGGLKQYVGATGPNDYGYAAKVLAERDRIRRVMFGNTVPDIDRILLAGHNANTDPLNQGTVAQAATSSPSTLLQ